MVKVKPIVYVGTSVIGYLTSWPSRDIVVAGHQKATRTWWESALNRFELYISELVVQECSEGDAGAVASRLEAIVGLPTLQLSDESEVLADALVAGHAVPEPYYEDALHIALATVHGIDFLVTWNFRHIANASIRGKIEEGCREGGYEPPIICSPEELME